MQQVFAGLHILIMESARWNLNARQPRFKQMEMLDSSSAFIALVVRSSTALLGKVGFDARTIDRFWGIDVYRCVSRKSIIAKKRIY